MASLTNTATNARKIIIGFLIFSALILALDITGRVINNINEGFAPEPSPWAAADEALGIIDPPEIDSLEIGPDSNPTFVIDGDLPAGPNAPETALVYQVNVPRTSLSTVDNAVRTATALGFLGNYEEFDSPTILNRLEWSKNDGVRQLEYEITSNYERWRMITQYNFDSSAQLPKQLEATTSYYTQRARGIISTLGFGQDTLVDGFQVATFGKLGPDGLLRQPINNRSADYVDIQLYHGLPISLAARAAEDFEGNYEDLQGTVYRNNPLSGSLSMIASNDLGDLTTDIYNLEYRRFEYNTNSYGIYPIVSPAQAWQRIRDGEGSLTLMQTQPIDRFAGNKVLDVERFTAEGPSTELAYFQPETWENYIYPIYVFRGRIDTVDGQIGRFVFYVDALERF